MTIVCGTDFSVYATHAANVAAALAVRRNSTLTLVHALEPARLDFLPGTHMDHLRKKLRRKLVTEGNRLRTNGVEVMESLVVGRPHEVLAHAAQPTKADLIIVSSIGQFAPSRWLVGSVAEKLVQISKVPTLVVRDHAVLLDWAKGEGRLKVFVGYDFSASADAALHWAASLGCLGACRTVVTCISWPPQETWRFGTRGRTSLTGNGPEVPTLLERSLEERCAQAFGSEMPACRVVPGWGPLEERLIELAEAETADLIVLGTNQRRGLHRFWLGSVSRGVLNHTSMNVACVPCMEQPDGIVDRITGPLMRRSSRPVLVVRQ